MKRYVMLITDVKSGHATYRYFSNPLVMFKVGKMTKEAGREVKYYKEIREKETNEQ